MKNTKAFTLIEVMIVVAVVAILAAIAVPMYQEQIRKSKRADAMQALLAASEAVERYKAANFSYANLDGNLAEVFAVQVPVDGGAAYFDLAIAADATSYRITATPKDSMKNDCSFAITNAGVRSYTKGSKCSTVDNW
ncbi:MAG: prepilin-type N-terminal cleavage/methylation domain-containing protein [Gammaproteobacteria bacterium]|nr:prepilin-type N-terminal cleavage/methylation domain-containing protein [Gammaproteobacteria bacterium]